LRSGESLKVTESSENKSPVFSSIYYGRSGTFNWANWLSITWS